MDALEYIVLDYLPMFWLAQGLGPLVIPSNTCQ
jgi:hypothetical protein